MKKKRKKKRKVILHRLIFVLTILILIGISIFVYRKFFSKPVISLNGKSEINIEVFESYSEEGATAKLNSKDISDRIKIKGEVNTDQVGTYKIEYTVNNRNKEYSITRSVNVIDTVSPKIELKGSEKLTLNTESTYAEPGYRAEDNYDGDITSSVAVTGEVDTKKPGTYTLTYEVTDKSGNTASAVREVTVTLAPKATGGRIYLTFDDGPSSKVTPRILDILKANNVKATFFIIDYDDENEHLVKRIFEEGHTIGIHGYSHIYSKIYSSEEAFMKNITTLREKIKETTGYDSSVIRFPGGSSNLVSRDYNVGIMTRLTKLVKEEGYKYFDWNVESGDADGTTVDKDKIVSKVTCNLNKNGSNVVLMHDASTKTTTADALQAIIDYGKKNGFTFLPIDDSTEEIHHGVNN